MRAPACRINLKWEGIGLLATSKSGTLLRPDSVGCQRKVRNSVSEQKRGTHVH